MKPAGKLGPMIDVVGLPTLKQCRGQTERSHCWIKKSQSFAVTPANLKKYRIYLRYMAAIGI
jgi:hypothetical protein